MIDYSDWEPGTEALYLDDCRTPRDNHYFKWVIVRSAKQFRSYILNQGVPKFMSFDHDLGEDTAIENRAAGMSKRQARAIKRESPSGYEAAKWLVSHCLDNDIQMPHFTVHSANPAGAENILHLLNNLQREQGTEPTGYRTHW